MYIKAYYSYQIDGTRITVKYLPILTPISLSVGTNNNLTYLLHTTKVYHCKQVLQVCGPNLNNSSQRKCVVVCAGTDVLNCLTSNSFTLYVYLYLFTCIVGH